MKLSTECLKASQVDSLLQGNLTPEEDESAQNHLELCETCRDRVEAAIGPEQWWSDVQSVLRSKASLHVAASLRDAEGRRVKEVDPDAASLGETRLRENVLDLLGPTDDPNMLGRIGPYEIIGLLGQGGMGAVFKGFDRSLNRFVAIKMLLPHLAASGAARKRFAREGQAVAAVVDDHVMAIHCVDEWQGVPYLVMTYSRGVSLQKRLSDNGPLELRELLRIGLQAAKGLAAAHAQGIVHRDIKPANIFLDQNVERVQLMDFGLARAVDDASLTRSGTLAGTPQYMSPEQARAETVDHRSDLFSLGSVMYAMCTGHAPFRAESSYSVLRLITDKEPRPIREINSDIPEWLCEIVSELMAKQADDRFSSAQEVAQLLEDCLAHVQQPTLKELPGCLAQHRVPRSGSSRPARIIQRFKRFGIRSWLLAGISVAAIMLIAMMLQDNLPQRSGQGESGPLTTAHANLSELLQQQKAREESIRQISYHGTVRQYAQQKIKRTNTESVDEFVARCIGIAPVYDSVPPYPLSASRDFNSGVYRFTMSDINMSIPKYMDWFIDKKKYVQLMGRDPGTCEAVVTKNREDIQDDRKASIVRLDTAAFRPVNDILMSEVVMNAVGVPGIPDVAGRPLWKLEKLDNNKVGWKATFMFQQPIANPPGAKRILWYRVYWEQIGGELVIVRVDELPVIGDENSTPQSVTLIDDYRSVCGKPVPFRVRCFVLGDSFVQGAEFIVSDMKVNDYVDVPDQMQIPAGSSVRNQITGVKSRQPASKISDPTTDAELIQGTWNALELQQVGYEPSEGERGFYKNGGYKITFTKNKTIHSPDHSSMDYRLDTTQTPHVLELLQSGKVIAKAIYELAGDDLKICQGRTPTDGSAPEPPTSFDINQAPTKFPTLYVLRRTKPIEPMAIPMGVTASGAATKLPAIAVESDVSVALKIAVERDSSIPDKDWKSLDARNQAIDTRNVTGTPLTLIFLSMPKPATVSKLMIDELEVFESATVAGILDEIERNKGPFTFIHKDRISEIEYKIDKDVAVGTFSFLVPGLYKGKIGFRARKMETDWSITEFKLNAHGVQLVRDGESWKTKTVAVSESKRDIEKLRGEWRVTNIRPRSQRPRSQEVEVTKFEESSFVFTESHLTVTGTGTEKRVAEITLRDDSSPKEIDLKATEGVGAGKTAYGIYRFDGDRLVLCIGEVRPVKFSDDDAGLLVLERRQINNQSLRTPAIDHRNARSVVERYIALALAGDVAKAAALAKNSPADPKRIRELPELLNVQRLKIETVYINDPAKPTRALATSAAVKLDEEHKQPDGQRDGFMVFTLELTDDKWFVIDIDFESESGAEKELKRFLEANPMGVAAPDSITDNKAEELFRQMERACVQAKSANVIFSGNFQCAFDGELKGRLLLATDNKFRLEINGDLVMGKSRTQPVKLAIVCDGKQSMTASLDPKAPSQVVNVSKDKDDDSKARFQFARAGVLAPMFILAENVQPGQKPLEFNAEKQFGVSDFELGENQIISGQQALTIKHKFHNRNYTEPLAVTVWLDAKTKLPLQREMIVKQGEHMITLTENYSTMALNEQTDEKEFELPKQAKATPNRRRFQFREATIVDDKQIQSEKSIQTTVVEFAGKQLRIDHAQEPMLTEDDIVTVEPIIDASNTIASQLVFTLTPEAGERLLVETTRLSSQTPPGYLVVEFNGTVISALRVNDKIINKVVFSFAELDKLDLERLVPTINESIKAREREKTNEKELESVKSSTMILSNARSLVEAYVSSALAGDVAKAASLAKNSPADPKRIREFPESLNVQKLKIETVHVDDPAKPTRALATSQSVKLDEELKQSDGQRDGFMVFSLELTEDKWFVIDIDFESELGAEKELKRFLEANPNSFGLPPLTSSSMPNLSPATETSDDHVRIQGAWQFDSKSLPTMPAGNQFSVSFLADRMSFSGPQKAGIGTFRLSPDTVPKQIDCRLTFAEKQLELIGIYEFHDDQLWLCLTEGEQRPKSFDNPPALARLMNFSLERKRVKLPEVDSNASLALSDWSQSQVGAGVFATYTLSIPGIETISQGLAAGGPAVKEFSGIPGGPEKVFTLRYFLPNLSPRGMEFVARNSFRSSLDLIELSQVAEHKRLVKVFSYPDSATEPIASNLTISVLKAGADQADWLKEIDTTGEIIFLSAFISSSLFLVAARLLYSTTQQKPIAGSQRFSTAAIVLALYAPFYWAFNSSWLHLLPVLPGFTAGMFTKPLDSRLAFFAASGTCTVLLLVSLCIIRNRVRYGRFNAPVIAWCASVIASYAAYSFMRA